MDVWKSRDTALVLVVSLLVLLLLPACDGAATPPGETPSPLAVQSPATPPVLTIKQELEDQLEMLQALVEAEKGRGRDVSQVERQLDEAAQALQFADLLLARQKLREAGNALGVRLP